VTGGRTASAAKDHTLYIRVTSDRSQKGCARKRTANVLFIIVGLSEFDKIDTGATHTFLLYITPTGHLDILVVPSRSYARSANTLSRRGSIP
jgi:hypothetical protein